MMFGPSSERIELPAGAALATLEWHRGYQADAEVARLLRQHDGHAAGARGARRVAAAEDRGGPDPRRSTSRGRPPG